MTLGGITIGLSRIVSLLAGARELRPLTLSVKRTRLNRCAQLPLLFGLMT